MFIVCIGHSTVVVALLFGTECHLGRCSLLLQSLLSNILIVKNYLAIFVHNQVVLRPLLIVKFFAELLVSGHNLLDLTCLVLML